MYKRIETDAWGPSDEPPIVILDDLMDDSVLTKRAADDRIQSYVQSLEPKPGKSYLHINAMTSGEYYGSNRNGDYFPENNLIDYYKTFETSPAHVFRSHVNKDPRKGMGHVLYAIFNERMHRVELISEVDKELAKDIEDKIAQGEYPFTSMACKTPYDICSICGNKATSPQQYCSHLKRQLNQLLPDGRRVMAINSGPLKFFDISIVIRPADATSSVLQKVASNEGTTGSAELAESEGLNDDYLTGMSTEKQASIKLAALAKLSELTKTIDEGNVVGVHTVEDDILDKVQDPEPEIIDTLASIPTEDMLNGLADAGISPSLSYLAELFARKLLGQEGKGHGHLAVMVIQGNKDPSVLEDHTKQGAEILGEVEEKAPTSTLKRLLGPQMKQASLRTSFATQRSLTKKASEPYYLNYPQWYDQGEPRSVTPDTPYGQVMSPRQKAMAQDNGESFWKSLAALGGIALASKLYIDNLVRKKHEKLEREMLERSANPENRVKIQIEKAAEHTDSLAAAVSLGIPGIQRELWFLRS